jgi:hypothetical protein
LALFSLYALDSKKAASERHALGLGEVPPEEVDSDRNRALGGACTFEVEGLRRKLGETCFARCCKTPVAVEEKAVLRDEEIDDDASRADVLYEALELPGGGRREARSKRRINSDRFEWKVGRGFGLDP